MVISHEIVETLFIHINDTFVYGKMSINIKSQTKQNSYQFKFKLKTELKLKKKNMSSSIFGYKHTVDHQVHFVEKVTRKSVAVTEFVKLKQHCGRLYFQNHF